MGNNFQSLFCVVDFFLLNDNVPLTASKCIDSQSLALNYSMHLQLVLILKLFVRIVFQAFLSVLNKITKRSLQEISSDRYINEQEKTVQIWQYVRDHRD